MHPMIGKYLRHALLAPLAFLAAIPAYAQDGDAELYAFTQDYVPEPALWVVADEDTTIYMMGTIHALPRGFRWRSPRINDIIEESDTLVVESSDYATVADPINLSDKLNQRVARRRPTSSYLSTEGRRYWRDLISRSPVPYESADSMPVMLALLTLGVTGDGAGMSLTAFGVETILEREFRARNRPIEALEDSGEVMYSLLRLETPEILDELDQRLISWEGKPIGYFYNEDHEETTGNDYWESEHLWAQGIVAEDFSLGFGEGPIGSAMDAMLLDRRNTEWAGWIEQRLDEPGTIFLAVGAGHFEGDVSLLVKLEERGIAVERIN